MASQGNSQHVLGPLASMFTGEALSAISAEEHADKLAQEKFDIEQQSIAAATATAAAEAEASAAATASAEADALLGSVGLPTQQWALHRHLRMRV